MLRNLTAWILLSVQIQLYIEYIWTYYMGVRI